mmetsp:Transcript_8414/g.26184  ORF Transcript_8414/g.26184 Transcript_8414/m.26184 type:complete len:222 (-) Transcript_8414:571-1236(-)
MRAEESEESRPGRRRPGTIVGTSAFERVCLIKKWLVSRRVARRQRSEAMTDAKILFLDVDGVLNTEFCRPRDAIHLKLVQRLSEVIAFSGAKLVLSSTWRLHPVYRQRLLRELTNAGIDESCVIDDTPSLPLKLGPWPPAEAQRAAEIFEWLQRAHPTPSVWAAVDDLDLTQSPHADVFSGHFVRTSKESGLSEACSSELCFILGADSRLDHPDALDRSAS